MTFELWLGMTTWRSIDASFLPAASGTERAAALLGGIIFSISDIALGRLDFTSTTSIPHHYLPIHILLSGINAFVRPIRNSKVIILSTYYLAQYCLSIWAICAAERLRLVFKMTIISLSDWPASLILIG